MGSINSHQDTSRQDVYEVCPKSIQPAFISSRQSARLASAGYERNQQSLTNSLNAVVTSRTPWVARSVCLCPRCFFRSRHLFIVENDRKNRSTNLHQICSNLGKRCTETIEMIRKAFVDESMEWYRRLKSTSKSESSQVNADYFFRLLGCCALRICSKRSDHQQRILR